MVEKLEKDINKLKELGVILFEEERYEDETTSLGKEVYNAIDRDKNFEYEIDVRVLGNLTLHLQVYDICLIEGDRYSLVEDIKYNFSNNKEVLKVIFKYIQQQKQLYATKAFKRVE